MSDIQHWFSSECFDKEKLSSDIEKHVLLSQIDDLKGRIDIVRGAIDDVKPPQRFTSFVEQFAHQQRMPTSQQSIGYGRGLGNIFGGILE